MKVERTGPLRLRPMRPGDVPEVVTIHRQAFPGFFLSFLGPRFLAELYRSIAADPSGMAFVCQDQDLLIGFVAGSVEPAGLYGRLARQRAVHFAWASLGAVWRRPAILPRLWRALRRPAEAAAVTDPHALLMSVAVLPEVQGLGAGRALVAAFIDAVQQRGLRQIRLTTDRDANETVNGFYRRQGFTCARTLVTPEGRAMNEYVYLIPNS